MQELDKKLKEAIKNNKIEDIKKCIEQNAIFERERAFENKAPIDVAAESIAVSLEVFQLIVDKTPLSVINGLPSADRSPLDLLMASLVNANLNYEQEKLALDKLSYLLKKGANANATYAATADTYLHRAVSSKKAVELLLAHIDRKLIDQRNHLGDTALLTAVKKVTPPEDRMLCQTIQLLIENGAALNVRNNDHKSVLDEAIVFNTDKKQLRSFSIARLLIEKGAEFSGALHDVFDQLEKHTHYVALARQMVEKGFLKTKKEFDIDKPDQKGVTYLAKAMLKDNFALFELLLQKGVNRDSVYDGDPIIFSTVYAKAKRQDSNGYESLEYSFKPNGLRYAHKLLDYGANANLCDAYTNSNLLAILIKYGTQQITSNSSVNYYHSQYGHSTKDAVYNLFEHLLQRGADPNNLADGAPILLRAWRLAIDSHSNSDFFDILLEYNASPNQNFPGTHEWSHYYSYSGGLLHYCMRSAYDYSQNQNTYAHSSSTGHNKYLLCTEKLLDAGANVEFKNPQGKTVSEVTISGGTKLGDIEFVKATLAAAPTRQKIKKKPITTPNNLETSSEMKKSFEQEKAVALANLAKVKEDFENLKTQLAGFVELAETSKTLSHRINSLEQQLEAKTIEIKQLNEFNQKLQNELKELQENQALVETIEKLSQTVAEQYKMLEQLPLIQTQLSILDKKINSQATQDRYWGYDKLIQEYERINSSEKLMQFVNARDTEDLQYLPLFKWTDQLNEFQKIQIQQKGAIVELKDLVHNLSAFCSKYQPQISEGIHLEGLAKDQARKLLRGLRAVKTSEKLSKQLPGLMVHELANELLNNNSNLEPALEKKLIEIKKEDLALYKNPDDAKFSRFTASEKASIRQMMAVDIEAEVDKKLKKLSGIEITDKKKESQTEMVISKFEFDPASRIPNNTSRLARALEACLLDESLEPSYKTRLEVLPKQYLEEKIQLLQRLTGEQKPSANLSQNPSTTFHQSTRSTAAATSLPEMSQSKN